MILTLLQTDIVWDDAEANIAVITRLTILMSFFFIPEFAPSSFFRVAI